MLALAVALLATLAVSLAAQAPAGLLWEHDAASRVEAVAVSEDGAYVAVGGRDNSLRLFSGSGELLWRASLGGQVNSGPMSYAIDGRQYIAISAGTALFTFALP